MKRVAPSKLKETITTTTAATNTKKASKMPSRTGKKEEPTPAETTTTKVINFEEVEGEEQMYFYNKAYIEEFLDEYVNRYVYGTIDNQLQFLERHLVSQDTSVADKLNHELVNLTPKVVNIVGSQFHEK